MYIHQYIYALYIHQYMCTLYIHIRKTYTLIVSHNKKMIYKFIIYELS